MQTDFHNPYHFVPVQRGNRQGDRRVEDFKRGVVGNFTHDRFYSGSGQDVAYSGRLICRLTTEDPVVVGGRREKLADESHRVHPFEIKEGEPAIPASTLRGLISSLAEAASNSALRVLEKAEYSRRVEDIGKESLSAIGMIIEVDHGNGRPAFALRPLALPTMAGPPNGKFGLDDRYHIMFPVESVPPLKLYIGIGDEIRSSSFVDGLPYRTFSREHPDYFYVKLQARQWNEDHTLTKDSCQHCKDTPNRSFLVAQKPTDGKQPIPESEVQGSAEERNAYKRGILRVLGAVDRPDMPATKKHELFLPYPEEAEDGKVFPILPEAIDNFRRLANEGMIPGVKKASW